MTPVVVVVGGWGITFLHGLSRGPMYCFEKFESMTPYFCRFSSFFISKVHVWFEAHVWSRRARGSHPVLKSEWEMNYLLLLKEKGVTHHSKIVV